MSSQNLPAKSHTAIVLPDVFSNDQWEVIRKSIAPDCSHQELYVFGEVCKAANLNPFLKEIYPLKVGGRMIPFVGIDGYRVIAARAGKTIPPSLSFDYDGKQLVRATASGRVKVGDEWHPLSASVRFEERKPADGRDATWRKMPETMLGKCAEAAYYRMAGIQGLQGLALYEERHLFEEDRPAASFACEECGSEMSATSAALAKKAHKRLLCEQHRPKVRRVDQAPAPAPEAEKPEPASDQNAPPLLDQFQITVDEVGLTAAQLAICFKRCGIEPTKDWTKLSDDQLRAMIQAARQF